MTNHIKLLAVVACLTPCLGGFSFSQQVIPESPAIWREVTGVITDYSTTPATPKFTRPHMPGLRVTSDGRVGIIVEGGGTEGSTPRFALMMPEKMTQPFLLSNPYGPDSANSHTMSSTTFKWMDGYTTAFQSRLQYTDGVKGVSHAALWNDNPPTVNASGQDVYDVKVFVSSNTNVNEVRRTQFFVTPIRIIVSNPKTASAAITSITKTGTTIAGPEFPFHAAGFEPVVAGDGRFLMIRVGSPSMPWTNPNTGAAMPAQGCDIVYSYYPSGNSADASQWTNLIPITYAPYDNRINTKFGFAMAPFRDAEGTLITPGEDLGASYPWLDRDAKNLFIEAINDTLHYSVSGNWNNSRYPQTAVPEEPASYLGEDGGKHQGVSFLGLWSHGKLVQIDNLNNDMDYAIGLGDSGNGPQQRLVNLFQPNSGPYGNESGWLRLGYGRATIKMPKGENDNGNIIDSLENLLNYRTKFFPVTLRDVVWPLTNGKQTDELAFDDYVDPDAFIVANMTGLLTFNVAGAASSSGSNSLVHHSGWNNTTKTFSNPVKLQNAATAPTTHWITPKHGLVIGNGRLEPAATGGVHGKGFYMNGSIGLEFTVDAQPQSVSSKDWYVGLFVDCRHIDDSTERRLLTFPDNTSIRLRGRRQIIYADAAGVIVNRITIPLVSTSTPASDLLDDLLPDRGWAHLAFQIRKGGAEVDFHLNGLLYHRWQDVYTGLFQLPPGKLTIGKPASAAVTGFHGWVDDFKVFAHAVDLETAANHANGTLIGLPSTYTGQWKTKFADRFPTWAHEEVTKVLRNNGEATHPRYAVFYNYMADNQIHRGSIPAGTVSLRNSIHFPEGPLFHNAPRPDSVTNQFCITCHHTNGKGGLDLEALELDTMLLAKEDNRRQPMQPPKRIHGRIPAGLIDSTNQPTALTDLPAGGKLIDEWMLSAYTGPAVVQSFTLVDANTGRDLMPLTSGAVVDPAKLGTTNLTIRANLNTAQGSVAMQYDSNSVNTRHVPPYAVFGNASNPLLGATLTPGAHSIKATPTGGALTTVNFTVAGGTTRVIADYRDDFKPVAPLPGWSYCWNQTGAVSNPLSYRNLAWTPSSSRYGVSGLVVPDMTVPEGAYASLNSTGGHPGRGTAQATAADRFAIAGYTVKLAGYYGISSSFVTIGTAASNGGQVVIYTDTNGGATFTNKHTSTFAPTVAHPFNGNVGYLQPGDTIYVGIGPNGHDGSDSFTLDFSIVYKESSNPL
ncbi:hypothetical protein FEM03_01050 [Phragmitibacter flavus]|uniref:Uncharacterized protein n=1 Tax=Phragmitibacter flavus TaxID=2576071 RepID=A0A5R8KK42_9BACT|nr:hypothetical protein [Phragmitibacter flavus]TLD72693.1 hypothetical protein FEM03_01050 [Phragmitibacter flavus]